MPELSKMRDEHQQANDRRAQGGDQHRGRRHILGPADPGMPLRIEGVSQLLESGIEGFGAPDQDDGRADLHPLFAAQADISTRSTHQHRGQQMQPRVGLRAHEKNHAVQGVAEALQETVGGLFHGSLERRFPIFTISALLRMRANPSAAAA